MNQDYVCGFSALGHHLVETGLHRGLPACPTRNKMEFRLTRGCGQAHPRELSCHGLREQSFAACRASHDHSGKLGNPQGSFEGEP